MEHEQPKVRMTLQGQDGNAFNLLALFRSQAKRQGWQRAKIDAVLSEARSDDYPHLLATLLDHVEEPGDLEPDEES